MSLPFHYRDQTYAFEVGEKLSEEQLLEILGSHKDGLENFIIPDVSRHDVRAEYTDGTLMLEEVTKIRSGIYSLHFQYGWYAHHGCKDQRRGDVEFDEIRFTYRKGTVTFRKAIVEKRSTYEEF